MIKVHNQKSPPTQRDMEKGDLLKQAKMKGWLQLLLRWAKDQE